MTNKVTERISFQYFLKQMKLYALILLDLNIVLKMYQTKSKTKSISHKVSKIKFDDSIMCECYCIAFIEYTIAEKALLDYTNLFFSIDYQNYDKKICKYSKEKYGKGKRKTCPFTERIRLNIKLCF